VKAACAQLIHIPDLRVAESRGGLVTNSWRWIGPVG
jgi:hypothetical protein